MRSLSKDFKSQRPLLISPSQAEAFLERCASIEIPMGSKMTDMGEMLAAIFGEKQTLEKFPPYAIVPMKGVISKNISELESLCGGCDIQDVEEMLEECERDPAIKTIILDIDSPGGTSVGVPELANRVKNCKKEVISFTASECCSAAYWIGSQASAFYATPSSTVGSVGVYIAYPDCSEAYKMEGVRMEVIKSGLFKGAGIPGTSLDANQRKMLQDEVNEIHGDFKAAVKGVREFVDDASMEGQTFSGKKAAEAGIVTSLTNGFDELMESLDAAIATQMEADEENDERQECAEAVGHEAEEEEGEDYDMKRMASSRALAGIEVDVLKAVSKKPKVEEEAEEEDAEDEKKDGSPAQPKSGKLPAKMDEEDEEGPEEEAADAEKCEDEAKAESEDDCDPEDPDCDPEKEEASTEDAEEEADAGEKAVDTDADADKSKQKRHKSRGVA
jgi:signal peptide peptidase SppA